VELSETFPVAAPPERVWAFVDDAAALADCIPGAELLDRREDGTYEGRIAFTLGPKQIHFAGTVTFENDVPARRGTLDVKGADARGGSRAKGHVKYVVEPLDDGTRSNVTLVASLVFYGPLAGFAETGGLEVGRGILREFASCLAAKVEATSSTAAANVTARKIGLSQLLLAALRGWLQRAPWRRQREAATPISPELATNGNPHDAPGKGRS